MTFKKWFKNQNFRTQNCQFQKPPKHSVFSDFTRSGVWKNPSFRGDASTSIAQKTVVWTQGPGFSAPEFELRALKALFWKSNFHIFAVLRNFSLFCLEIAVSEAKNMKNLKFSKMPHNSILRVPKCPKNLPRLSGSILNAVGTTVCRVEVLQILAEILDFFQYINIVPLGYPINAYFMYLGVRRTPSSRGDAGTSIAQKTVVWTQGPGFSAPEFELRALKALFWKSNFHIFAVLRNFSLFCLEIAVAKCLKADGWKKVRIRFPK